MAGGNLFARAFGYVINEFLVEGLANKYARLPSPSPPSEIISIYTPASR